MPKGGQRTPPGGRPRVPDNLKRIPCTNIRLPRWLLDWLVEQPISAGRIIEAALREKYGLDVPKGRVRD